LVRDIGPKTQDKAGLRPTQRHHWVVEDEVEREMLTVQRHAVKLRTEINVNVVASGQNMGRWPQINWDYVCETAGCA
jgi:hypothetical protein